VSIRLIAIDIDGTLLPSSGSCISQRNREAISAAEAAGIEIVISTGRREAFAMPLVAPLGLKGDSVMVSSNGAVVRRFDGHLISRRYLSAATCRELCHELRGYETLVFTFDGDRPGSLVVEDIRPLRARIGKWVESNGPYLMEVRPIERAFDGEALPIQGMICGTVEEMKLAEQRLRAMGKDREIAMHRTEYTARELSILDLLPLGCSKGTAIERLAQLWNLSRSEIMAIGDNLNDLEMLDYSGRPVVMANANEEALEIARQRGWEITASNDEDGVGLAVESVLARTPGYNPEISSGDPDGNPGKTDSEDTMVGWVK
jgi:Cof subfamily protein (haloacid dehalogenase superfamily)